jgi:predicted transcriptional regulator
MDMYKLVHVGSLEDETTPLEQMLGCLIGLSKMECQIFTKLLEHPGGECCQELARMERKHRTVIQKIMKRLLDIGLIERKPVPLKSSDAKSYKFVYTPVPRPVLRSLLLSMIDETRLRMIEVVDEVLPASERIN